MVLLRLSNGGHVTTIMDGGHAWDWTPCIKKSGGSVEYDFISKLTGEVIPDEVAQQALDLLMGTH